MTKSIKVRLKVQQVAVRSVHVKHAIKVTDPNGRACIISDVPGTNSYAPGVYRNLKYLLLHWDAGGWYEAGLPSYGAASITLAFTVWYSEREQSIHVTAPKLPNLRFRVTESEERFNVTDLFLSLYDLLGEAGKIPGFDDMD